jgi:hypothetical protein
MFQCGATKGLVRKDIASPANIKSPVPIGFDAKGFPLQSPEFERLLFRTSTFLGYDPISSGSLCGFKGLEGPSNNGFGSVAYNEWG